MKAILTYLASSNKKIYKEIAKLKKCSAVRVCSLAHGKKAKNGDDFDIIQILVEKGIVSGMKMGFR